MSQHAFRIARSKTGLGMFATQRIPKNTRIFEYTGRIITNEAADRLPGKPRYLYDLNKKFTLDGSPRSNLGRYANHSCRPNAVDYSYRGRGVCEVPSRDRTWGGDHVRLRKKSIFDAFIGKENCLCVKCVARREREPAKKPKRAAASTRVDKKSKR
jgi:hypothetical protein